MKIAVKLPYRTIYLLKGCMKKFGSVSGRSKRNEFGVDSYIRIPIGDKAFVRTGSCYCRSNNGRKYEKIIEFHAYGGVLGDRPYMYAVSYRCPFHLNERGNSRVVKYDAGIRCGHYACYARGEKFI